MRRTNKRYVVLSCLLALLCVAAAMFVSCAPQMTGLGATVVDRKEVGEGQTTVTFTAVNSQKEATVFTVHTDKTTLGEALLEHGIIAGREEGYGLWITTVNGVVANEANQEWWKLYEGDAMSNYGISSLKIQDGGEYTLALTVGY